MPGISAVADADPKAMDQLARGDIAPVSLDIALVFALVVNDRLAVLRAPLPHALDVPILDADVGHAFLCMVIAVLVAAVVNRAQMVVGIAQTDDVKKPIPHFHRLVAQHKVVLVGHRPPNVGIGRQAGYHVAQIGEVALVRHGGKSPAIVGMEENQVGLDAQIAQFLNAPLKMAEKIDVVTGEIPLAVASLFKRIVHRLVLVEDVVFGKDAHAHLVEAGRLQRFERLLLQRVSLMGPSIAGRAEGIVGRAVGIGEVKGIAHAHRTVPVCAGLYAGESAALTA